MKGIYYTMVNGVLDVDMKALNADHPGILCFPSFITQLTFQSKSWPSAVCDFVLCDFMTCCGTAGGSGRLCGLMYLKFKRKKVISYL